MSEPPDSEPAATRTAAKGRWPAWTGWFLVRAAALAGMLWAFENGPRAFRWPLRFLILATSVLVVLSFVRESRLAVAWAAARWRACFHRPAGPQARIAVRIEQGFAWLVAILVVVHVGLLMTRMSQTSLREDELGTIVLYSARGPLETTTKYNLAKNHVFFNLVNSLTPGRASVHPLRARIWAFAAVAATLIVAGWWFFRRGEYAEGALVLAALGFNLPQLAISLEARGYGFLLCAAAVSSLVLPRIVAERGQSGRVAVLALATTLGIYTIPSYLVFGGALLLIAWLVAPTRRTFLAGWFACVAVILLYLPLASQLAQVAGEYDEKYLGQFTDVKRMLFALRYLIPQPVFTFSDWSLVCAFALIPAVPALLGIHDRPRARVAAILFGLVGGFYAFCLWLKSPPDRVTAFLAAPAAIAAAFLVAETRIRFPRLRSWLGIGMTSLLCLAGVLAIRSFHYDPPQRWRDVALFIRTLFPPGTQVWVPGRYSQANALYLGPEYPVRAKEPGGRALARGGWVLHDDRLRRDEPAKLDLEALPADRIRIPFRTRGAETRLFIARTGLANASLEVVGDGRWVLRTDVPAYALGLEADFDWAASTASRGIEVRVRDSAGGRWLPAKFRLEDRFLAIQVPVSTAPLEVSVAVVWRPDARSGGVLSAWAVPPSASTTDSTATP